MKNGDVASTFQATNTMPNMSPADVVADGMFSAGQNGLTWLADGSAQLERGLCPATARVGFPVRVAAAINSRHIPIRSMAHGRVRTLALTQSQC